VLFDFFVAMLGTSFLPGRKTIFFRFCAIQTTNNIFPPLNGGGKRSEVLERNPSKTRVDPKF
jgi:hypothetical protein